jgi:DNA polymerase-3 subunit gamma/tau
VLERVGQLGTQGYDLSAFCTELTRYIRNLMVARSCGAQSPLLQAPDEERVDLGKLSPLFSEEDLARFFHVLLRAQNEMRYSLEPRFHLELALMKLVHARKLVAIESLLSRIRGQMSAEPPPKGAAGTSSNAQRTRAAAPTTSGAPGKSIGPQPDRLPRKFAASAGEVAMAAAGAQVADQIALAPGAGQAVAPAPAPGRGASEGNGSPEHRRRLSRRH